MSSQDVPIQPPKPRLTLRVGVSGKRKIDATQHKRIKDELAGVFEHLAIVLTTCWENDRRAFDDRPPVLRIISGLAEGADQLAAEAAVDRIAGRRPTRGKAETRLAAILPFPRDKYIADFENDPNKEPGKDKRSPAELADVVGRFDALLTEARKSAVLEICDEATFAPNAKPEHRDGGYVALRDLLIQHSDIIVAVLDESKERKRGGSADVVHFATQDGVPVICVGTTAAPVCLMYAAEPDDPDQTPTRKDNEQFDLAGPPHEALASILAAMLSPPHDTSRSAAPASDHSGLHHTNRSGRARLLDFLDERFRLESFAWIFKACRDSLLKWKAPNEHNSVIVACGEIGRSARSYKVAPPEVAVTTLWRSEDPLVAPYSEELRFRGVLANRYVWADTVAVRYADANRSSYIAIAVFGAFAIFVGLLAVFFWGHWAAPAKIALLIAEGSILLFAGGYFYRPAHNNSWHERMVEARVLAELLRHQRFVYAMGGAERTERLGDRSWREPDAWLSWYVRATIRELGFPTAQLCAEYRRVALAKFQSDELQPQIDYNNTERARSKIIDDSLGAFVERAWRWAVWIAGLGALLVLALYLVERSHGAYAQLAETLLVYIVKPGLTIILAVLPAAIAAVHGVRFQMEFANAAKRAATTYQELSVLNNSKVKPTLDSAEPPGRRKAYSLVQAANEAMVADLTGWSTVYKHKAAEPPG
jgi:hypothetical protein